MTAEHADPADLIRNKEVVLRFMRLMDGAPSDPDALDEVWSRSSASDWGLPLRQNPDKGLHPSGLPRFQTTRIHLRRYSPLVTGWSFAQRTARPTAATFRALLRPGGAYHGPDCNLSDGRWHNL